MGIIGIDLDKLNLDDHNFFIKMFLELLFMSGIWLGIINLKNPKHLKKI